MLRILPLADDLILPQTRQEIYFFNRIGQKRSLTSWVKFSVVVRVAPPLSCIKCWLQLVRNRAMVKYH